MTGPRRPSRPLFRRTVVAMTQKGDRTFVVVVSSSDSRTTQGSSLGSRPGVIFVLCLDHRPIYFVPSASLSGFLLCSLRRTFHKSVLFDLDREFPILIDASVVLSLRARLFYSARLRTFIFCRNGRVPLGSSGGTKLVSEVPSSTFLSLPST